LGKSSASSYPPYQNLFEAERRCLLKNIQPDAVVLDVGCGDGRNMRTILEKTLYVTGIDNDKKAVKDAEKHFDAFPTVKIVYAEAISLPFEDGLFDIVTYLMILPNLDTHKEKALSEAVRVLKPGGIIILSSFSETAFDERMEVYKKVGAPIVRTEGTKVIFDKSLGANTSEQFSKEQIQKLAQTAGLKVDECEDVGTLAYVCTLSKILK
jgi:ubiquinone/menaquinone biosynthesis C-methylase UbiE